MSNNKKVYRSPGEARVKKTTQQTSNHKALKKKIKIKYKKVIIFIVAVVLIALLIKSVYEIPIKNIIVKGNYYLTEQQVMVIADIRDYPSTLANSSYNLEKKLMKSEFIESAKVIKKNCLTKVIIAIDENRPLFYYQPAQKTVLEDGTMVDLKITVPLVINQVPDTVYDELRNVMKGVPLSVLDKMSEIKYVPTSVDPELFLIAMNDGNYVYVTLSKFERVYSYIEYAEGFDQKKGILHLDSGDYLEILEEE